MSYDYTLCRPAPAAGDIPEGPADLTTLGTFEQVAAQLERVFPGIAWRERRPHVWWGAGEEPAHVQVWLHVGMDPGATAVSSITLSSVDRPTVEGAAEALGLVALDTQKGEAFRPGRPGWKR